MYDILIKTADGNKNIISRVATKQMAMSKAKEIAMSFRKTAFIEPAKATSTFKAYQVLSQVMPCRYSFKQDVIELGVGPRALDLLDRVRNQGYRYMVSYSGQEIQVRVWS